MLGRQLQVGAEAVVRSGKRIGCHHSEDEQSNKYKAGDRQYLPKKKKKIKTIPTLRKIRHYF